MAYYIKKDKNSSKTPEQPEKKKLSKQQRSFFLILGYAIVLVIVLGIWAFRGGQQ